MSAEGPLTESTRGYLSDESKRRFTLVAGILGAAVFLAQMLLPFLLMLAVMAPTMLVGGGVSITDVTQAAVWREELWWVEQTVKLDWRDRERSESVLALRRARLAGLADAGPAIPLDATPSESIPALLALGDRLWLLGEDSVRYYENGSLSRLSGSGRPAGASKPFAYQGRPAVLTLGPPMLWTLSVEDGARAEWTAHELSLDLPEAGGSVTALQAVEAGGRIHLFAQLSSEAPAQCSLRYRALDGGGWQVVEDRCWSGSWTAVAVGGRPALVRSEHGKGQASRFALTTITADGPRREAIALEGGPVAWSRWGAFPRGGNVVLLSQGMPGSLRLAEVADGRVVHSARKKGSFPFGPNVMLLMTVPQLLPILLSLALAFVLTVLMRRHRVQEYAFGGERREFASLWKRALAQLVDLVPIVAGFAVPMVPMWRMMSDPESMIESGPTFPFLFFGLFLGAFMWGLLVLTAYSYFEGRFGKTPGKWLLGIRVLGTDLQPCGFGRALLRNLLTFVDGFFNFLVGALLVALTENWQRLGDLAARTVVVADEKPA